MKVDGRQYFCSRLAWLHVYGSWPAGSVDHINGDPTDDRIANLRDVSHAVNMQNKRRAHRNNTSGFLGVKASPCGSYQARITVNKVLLSLGTYQTAEQAHNAYLTAKRLHHPGCTI